MILKEGERMYGLAKALYDVLENVDTTKALLIIFESADELQQSILVGEDDTLEIHDDYIICVDATGIADIIDVDMFIKISVRYFWGE